MFGFLAIGAAVGAALAYFFDPQSGKRRRHVTVDWTAARVRDGGRQAARTGRGVASQAQGAKQKATHLKEQDKPQPDDVTLARKVETEIFRDAEVPKGNINVNAEDGVVYLRGEVGSEDMIADLEKAASKVKGVREVENLLHVPGKPAPTKQS